MSHHDVYRCSRAMYFGSSPPLPEDRSPQVAIWETDGHPLLSRCLADYHLFAKTNFNSSITRGITVEGGGCTHGK